MPSRSVGTAYGLWVLGLFGICGIHRFYLGKSGSGSLWFLTFGGLFIGQLADLFLIPGMVSDFNAEQLWQMSSPTLHPSMPLQGQALMRAIIRLAQTKGGILTITQTIGEIEADFDEIERAFVELTRRGYADPDNNVTTGAVEYRFTELLEEASLKG